MYSQPDMLALARTSAADLSRPRDMYADLEFMIMRQFQNAVSNSTINMLLSRGGGRRGATSQPHTLPSATKTLPGSEQSCQDPVEIYGKSRRILWVEGVGTGKDLLLRLQRCLRPISSPVTFACNSPLGVGSGIIVHPALCIHYLGVGTDANCEEHLLYQS